MNNADWDIALTKLRGVVGDENMGERLCFFTVEAEPVSKARARVNTHTRRSYTPARTMKAEALVAQHFKDALNGQTFKTSVAIVAVFFRPNYQRIDADNLMKLVLDAGTKAGAWVDDSYIVAQASFVELDRERPRTIVALCEGRSSLDRATFNVFTCRVCGSDFKRSGKATWKSPPQICSVACRSRDTIEGRVEARCPSCEKVFLRKTAGQRYCCKLCANRAPRVRQPDHLQRPPAVCQVCGARVSRREYLRCANCRPKGRTLGSKNRQKLAGVDSAPKMLEGFE